jgi:transposase
MQQGATTTSEVYCKTLKIYIENKRHGMLTPGVLLHHDNVWQQTAAITRALLERFNWELFEHAPYNPDVNKITTICLPTYRTC